ncbi:MAG: sulfotransferase domain-containing protein [Alphaproteobacteria bacterium]|nr:sulfotransferase domain-containing protein [Alphaproteobacteria bacterium]
MSDPRPIVWLAGYPSSGNIKAQIGLANLLFGRVTSITDLDSKIPPMTVQFRLPSSPASRDQNYVFTHLVATDGLINCGPIAGIVYVLRDPIDAGISSAGYLLPRALDYAAATPEQIETARATLIDFYMRFGTYEPYIAYGYGTWASHVLSWLNLAVLRKVPFHIIRFSDMRDRGEETLRAAAGFLGLAPSDDQIADALDNWSLARSRELEEKAIAGRERSRFYKPMLDSAYRKGWRYHGAGGIGYGRDRLSDAQWQSARFIFGPMADAMNLPIGP